MKKVKTHKFKLGKYKIEFVDKLYGYADAPHTFKDGKPINYCWEDMSKEMWIIDTGNDYEELDTLVHEALHAEGIPDEFIHDKEGNSDTYRLSKFLWRLGYRRKK